MIWRVAVIAGEGGNNVGKSRGTGHDGECRGRWFSTFLDSRKNCGQKGSGFESEDLVGAVAFGVGIKPRYRRIVAMWADICLLFVSCVAS